MVDKIIERYPPCAADSTSNTYIDADACKGILLIFLKFLNYFRLI